MLPSWAPLAPLCEEAEEEQEEEEEEDSSLQLTVTTVDDNKGGGPEGRAPNKHWRGAIPQCPPSDLILCLLHLRVVSKVHNYRE